MMQLYAVEWIVSLHFYKMDPIAEYMAGGLSSIHLLWQPSTPVMFSTTYIFDGKRRLNEFHSATKTVCAPVLNKHHKSINHLGI